MFLPQEHKEDPMAKRQREWAKRERDRIVRVLGGRCNCCGTTEHLEFDCIMPRSNGHARLERSQRITFYRRQLSVGNLQLLCRRCNLIKGDRILSITLLLRLVNSGNNPPDACETDGKGNPLW